MQSILSNRITQYLISGILVLGVMLIFFTPMVGILKRLSNFSVHIMLLYLVTGMFFFLYDQKRLVIVSLFCCGAICLFLKNASNQDMRFALENEGPKLRISLVDLSAAEDGYSRTIEHILSSEADIISVQELTPNWVSVLEESLGDSYPFYRTCARIDPYGMGVFSKLPFQEVDTFYFREIPNLRTTIEVREGLPFHLIHSISEAPVNEEAYIDIRAHFREVIMYNASLDGEVISMGNYHLPPWAPEIQEFKFDAGLKDSRRDGIPRPAKGLASFFGVPVDHIFYSDGLECTAFQVMLNENSSHLGVCGTYQLKAQASEL